MISSLIKYNSPEQLESIVNNSIDKVYIDGVTLSDRLEYHGYVNDIPYGKNIIVSTGKGKERFLFTKNTDGTIMVRG